MNNDITNLKYVEVPVVVLLDEDLSTTTKLLMGLITTLSMQEGFCFASNRYLSNLMKVSRRTITSCIASLRKKNLLSLLSESFTSSKIRSDNLFKFSGALFESFTTIPATRELLHRSFELGQLLDHIIDNEVTGFAADNKNDYIKFGLTTLKYDERKVFASFNINRNLYEIYKDFFVKGTKVFIKGYLNSYITNNKIQSFITVTDIANNQDEIMTGKKGPHIRLDPDGVEVWDGKRCEAIPPTEEELKEMEELLKEYQ